MFHKIVMSLMIHGTLMSQCDKFPIGSRHWIFEIEFLIHLKKIFGDMCESIIYMWI